MLPILSAWSLMLALGASPTPEPTPPPPVPLVAYQSACLDHPTCEKPPVVPLVAYRSVCLEHPTCEKPPAEAKDTTASQTAAAAPNPPPAPSPPAVSVPASVEAWRPLVADWFPASEVDKALDVMACESGGDPSAYNPSGASGLMQVMDWWAPEFGYSPADLFDPVINLEVARSVWDLQGWAAWSCA